MRCLIFLLLFSPLVLANNYKLGSGDKIQIIVYGEEDLTTEITIDKSGVISFPFLKDIQVVDLSVKELERVIYQGLLGDYLISPQVSVSVVQYRPFYIHGQVNRPGGYPYQENLTFDKAIAVAGGLSIRASKTNWAITRKVNGKMVIVDANVATQIMPDDIIKIEQSFF